MKYGLNLKLTKLEALEVGQWARTFQVAGNEEGPQLPNKQWLEPQKHNNHNKHQHPLMNCQSLNSRLKLAKRPVWLLSGHIACQ